MQSHSLSSSTPNILQLLITPKIESPSLASAEPTTPPLLDVKKESKEEKTTGKKNLSRRAAINAERLDALLIACRKKFIPNKEFPESNAALFDNITSELLQVNIGQIFYRHEKKYDSHLRLAANRTVKPDKNLGWEDYPFLYFNIRCYIEKYFLVDNKHFDLLDLSLDYTMILKNQADKRQAALHTFRTEILISLECLQMIRSFRQIKSIHLEKNYLSYRLKRNTLSQSIIKRLSSLKKDSYYILPAGASDHTFYVSFFVKKEKEEILVRCDNAGDGINEIYPKSHPSFPNKKLHDTVEGEEQLFVAPQLIAKRGAKESVMKEFINGLIHAYKNFHHSRVWDKTYDRKGNFGPLFEEPCTPSFPAQTRGNCVSHNWYMGEQLRINNPDLFHWIRTIQRKINTTHPTSGAATIHLHGQAEKMLPPSLQIFIKPEIAYFYLLLNISLPSIRFLDTKQLAILLKLLNEPSLKEETLFTNSWMEVIEYAFNEAMELREITLPNISLTEAQTAFYHKIIKCFPKLKIHQETEKELLKEEESLPSSSLSNLKFLCSEQSTDGPTKRLQMGRSA